MNIGKLVDALVELVVSLNDWVQIKIVDELKVTVKSKSITAGCTITVQKGSLYVNGKKIYEGEITVAENK